MPNHDLRTPPAGVSVPALLPGQPPIAFLVDYDGTISQVDVSEQLLTRFFVGDWHDDDEQYGQGIIGSRTFFLRQMPTFEGRKEDVVAFAAAQPHDRTFGAFVRAADELGVPVEVVSDWLGFFIEPALERLGVPHVPVVTAETTFHGGRAVMTFPNGNPDCFVCGTCKRNRVLAHQAAGRAVVFVGDGESDRYAAAHADVIFARDALVGMCEESSWPYRRWVDFAEIEAWLREAARVWRETGRSIEPSPHRLLCGPEVWGPGRTDPPPNEPVRDRTARLED